MDIAVGNVSPIWILQEKMCVLETAGIYVYLKGILLEYMCELYSYLIRRSVYSIELCMKKRGHNKEMTICLFNTYTENKVMIF